jgi:hypothetical protein
VIIGSDTLCGSGDTRLYVDTKWAVGPKWAVGLSGHWRYNMLARRVIDNVWGDSWTAEKVADYLRSTIREDGALQYDEKGAPNSHDLSGIITDGSRIWHMACDYSVVDLKEYGAAGCGREFATGAMWAVRGTTAQEIVATGLRAAIINCRGCGGDAWMMIFRGEAAEAQAVA